MIFTVRRYALIIGMVFFNTLAAKHYARPFKLAALYRKAVTLKSMVTQEASKHVVPRKVTLGIANPQSLHAPKDIKKGAMAIVGHNWNTSRIACMILSSDLIHKNHLVQSRVILHELAHAYDPFLKPVALVYAMQYIPMEDGFYPDACPLSYYPHIEHDARRCLKEYQKNGKPEGELLAYEWHADWQSIQWMKKYLPKEAHDLKVYQQDLIKQGYKRSPCPQYPSLEQLVKWLEEPV